MENHSFQIIFVDRMNQGVAKLDIVTPWIACVSIVHSAYLSIFVITFASFFLEAYYNLPKGQMLTCYFFIVCFINLTYPYLSWENSFSWGIIALSFLSKQNVSINSISP